MLLKVLNNKVNKKDRFICVSRPRRFGMTMAANMIAAYYSKGCDSHEREAEDVYVFHGLLSSYLTFHPLDYPSLLLRSVEIVIRAFKDCKVRKDLTGNGDIHHFV